MASLCQWSNKPQALRSHESDSAWGTWACVAWGTWACAEVLGIADSGKLLSTDRASEREG